MSILLIVALLPPFFLMAQIYKMDRIEKESPRLILRLFLLGVLSTFGAAIIEGALQPIVESWFPKTTIAYMFVYFFFVVAWAEEGMKHFMLKRGSWKSPEFNFQFDAVVYSVAVTLGFAAFENVNYVFSFGLPVGITRAWTAIPGHCIFGIFMGYYYGLARHAWIRGLRGKARFYQFLSIFVPVLLHGLYDFAAATSGSTLADYGFFVYLFILYIIAFRKVGSLSRGDDVL